MKSDAGQRTREEREAEVPRQVTHCKRTNGSERAWFNSKTAAEAFAQITPGYEGDIAHLCSACGYWHLARATWLRNDNYLATVASFTERIN